MSYASKQGRAIANPMAPSAAGVCDRCGRVVQHNTLRFQFDWRGSSLQNIRLLVCSDCEDTPQEQLRSFAVPADPLPVQNPRIQDFSSASNDYRTTSGQNTVDFFTGITIPGAIQRSTQTNDIRETQQIGRTGGTEIPPGLDANAAMPLFGKTVYDVKLPVIAMATTGSPIVTVTCSAPHNLVTNSQIAISNSALSTADGFYSVIVLDSLNFTYAVTSPIIGLTSILLPQTIVKTVLVGIPRGQLTIPQTQSVSQDTVLQKYSLYIDLGYWDVGYVA